MQGSAPEASVHSHHAGPETARPDPASPDWDELDRMLDEQPPGIPILPPEDAKNFSKYRYPPTIIPAPQAWKTCADAMEKYDIEICKAYREEIDTLLVFAGLFSAVVTAFTVESYQWLQDDPTDTTNALLTQIAHSLTPNGTAAVPQSSSRMGRAVSVRINAYWFISLALSLSATLVAILGKQWVREFGRRAADMPPKEVVGVRQLKFEGFEYWKVGDIISALPVLLQLSLALFALGVLELLWHLHVLVAVMVCIPIAISTLFYLTTTVLPVLQYAQRIEGGSPPPQCGYKSPQALAVIQVVQIVAKAWSHIHRRLSILLGESPVRYELGLLRRELSLPNYGWTHSWSVWDSGFYRSDLGSHFRGLDWLATNVHEGTVRGAHWNCLWDEAHLASTHHDEDDRLGGAERDTWLRNGLLHAWSFWQELLSTTPLWQCALPSVTRTDMAREPMSEILIHSLPSMDVSTAKVMFELFKDRFSNDPELVRSLVRAVLSYGRQHIHEDMSRLIVRTSNIVAHCSDYATQSALQWVLVVLAASSPSAWDLNVSQIRRHAFNMLSRSPEDFLHDPQRLHHLPHILALAALLRAEYERCHGPVTWPMSIPNGIEPYTLEGPSKLDPEWEPMVLEIFKISVLGVDCDSPARRLEQTSGSRESGIAHETHPPPGAAPLTGAAEATAAETAPARDAAERALRHSHESTLSAASLLSTGASSHGHDARDAPLHTAIALAADAASTRTLEIVIVPTNQDLACTSADAALLGSHAAEEAGSQDAGGGPTLARSDQEGADSMAIRHRDDTGVRAMGGPPEVDGGPPHASSGRMPPKTSGSPADPPSQRRRDPLAVALPREATVNARARETKRTDGQGEQAGARDQMPDDSGTDTATQAYRSVVMHTTTPLPNDSSDRPASAIAVNDGEVPPLADESASGGGDEAVHSVLADAGGEGFVPHARHRSLPPESREAPHTSVAEESRAVDAPSPDEGRARTVSSGAAGWKTQHRESAREADAKAEPATDAADEPSALASILQEHSGSTLADSAIPPLSHADAGVSADAAGSHPDAKSGVEGSGDCENEIAGGGGIPGT